MWIPKLSAHRQLLKSIVVVPVRTSSLDSRGLLTEHLEEPGVWLWWPIPYIAKLYLRWNTNQWIGQKYFNFSHKDQGMEIDYAIWQRSSQSASEQKFMPTIFFFKASNKIQEAGVSGPMGGCVYIKSFTHVWPFNNASASENLAWSYFQVL